MAFSVDRFMMEEEFKWREWSEKIPLIEFPAGWKIRMCPPYGCAMARFHVFANGKSVSVYLDVDNSLGWCPGPYWEVYPVQDTNMRVAMDDVEGLLTLIAEGCGIGPVTELPAPGVIEHDGGSSD